MRAASSRRAARARTGTDEQLAASGAAITLENERCNGIGDDNSRATIDTASKSVAALDDPLLGPLMRYRELREGESSSKFDSAAAMVRQAIAMADPNFMVEATSQLNEAATTIDGIDLGGRDDLRLVISIVIAEARCDLGADCGHGAAAMAGCYQHGDCGPYAERIGNWAGLTKDERLFIVQAGGEIAASARDATLPSRFRR